MLSVIRLATYNYCSLAPTNSFSQGVGGMILGEKMGVKSLLWQFLPSHGSLYQSRWCMKSLLWQFLPSHEGLSQPRCIEKSCSGTFFHRPVVYLKPDGLGKSFFSKIHPSPKGIFQPRWLNRASGFHRPRNSLSVDGTKSRDQVWKVEDFHHGRNFQCVDGV